MSTPKSRMTAEDVLFVLNHGEALDLGQYEFAVATAPSDMRFDYGRQRMVDEPSWFPFAQGEILIVNREGREPFGEGRHCRKWGVEFEYFTNLADAVSCRRRVLATAAVAGGAA